MASQAKDQKQSESETVTFTLSAVAVAALKKLQKLHFASRDTNDTAAMVCLLALTIPTSIIQARNSIFDYWIHEGIENSDSKVQVIQDRLKAATKRMQVAGRAQR